MLPAQELRDKPRSWAEQDLEFIGFLAFRCLVRKDSADIIQVRPWLTAALYGHDAFSFPSTRFLCFSLCFFLSSLSPSFTLLFNPPTLLPHSTCSSPPSSQSLRGSSHAVTMVTGDALLTAIYVAGEVGITRSDMTKVLTLVESDGKASGCGGRGCRGGKRPLLDALHNTLLVTVVYSLSGAGPRTTRITHHLMPRRWRSCHSRLTSA